MQNYTQEETAILIREYTKDPSKATVQALADKFSKSTKSVIGKLSREGVYRREVYRGKTGEVPITKVEIVNIIADYLGVEPDALDGLDKAPKHSLRSLEEACQKAATGSWQNREEIWIE